MKKFFLVTLALSFALTGISLAATPGEPDPAANPVLADFQKMGAKFYYLGKEAGMDGWFIIKDGKIQVMYGTPDQKAAVAGALVTAGNPNVTTEQIKKLLAAHPQIASEMAEAQKQVGETDGLPPEEKLMHDLVGASSVIVGKPASPEILMLANPSNPECQAGWRALRDLVAAGKIHLRIIPLGAAGSDDERAAAVFFGAGDAFGAWDKYEGGYKKILAGTPPDTAVQSVRANMLITQSSKIDGLPVFAYRTAKDGGVRFIKGAPKPETLKLILGDLGA